MPCHSRGDLLVFPSSRIQGPGFQHCSRTSWPETKEGKKSSNPSGGTTHPSLHITEVHRAKDVGKASGYRLQNHTNLKGGLEFGRRMWIGGQKKRKEKIERMDELGVLRKEWTPTRCPCDADAEMRRGSWRWMRPNHVGGRENNINTGNLENCQPRCLRFKSIMNPSRSTDQQNRTCSVLCAPQCRSD
jgi:hypothetical protein